MSELAVECPICDHVQLETVVEKTTAMCEKCHWPYDVYEDGRIAPSALAHVIGPLSVVDYRRWVWGQRHGHQDCMTLEKWRRTTSGASDPPP